MSGKLQIATSGDVPGIVALQSTVADTLTERYGQGGWSGVSTEKRILHDLRTSKVFVMYEARRLIATLRLTPKKPWAIDLRFFSACQQPIYLLSMAVTPDLQRQGIGRRCLEEVTRIGRQWPADGLRLDAYDALAGAGSFYDKCGFREVGRAAYRGCPLVYFEMML